MSASIQDGTRFRDFAFAAGDLMVTTDASGRYRFDDLLAAGEAQKKATKAAKTSAPKKA